ncbi:MAG: GNAT family N-acetyltransferase [Bacillota bacterium]|nr:GNAT family N-acetyltransferase [Bacillota bacterium]
MEIRSLEAGELPAALALAWESFLAYEAPEYAPEGVATFRASLESREFCAALEFWAAFEAGEMLGMLATRSGRQHISLFFVAIPHMRRGVGRALFRFLLPLCPGPALTVNSSPYAVPFYARLGFQAEGPEQLRDGIRFTPMRCPIPVGEDGVSAKE